MRVSGWGYLAVLLLPVGVTAGLVLRGMPLLPAGLVATAVQVLLLGALELRSAHGTPFLRDRGSWQDAAHGALLLSTARLTEPLVAAAVGGLGLDLWPTSLPMWSQVIGYLLLVDLLEYLRHRAMHTVPWLWPVHALHHDIDALHTFRKHRFHFGEGIIRALVIVAPLALLGAPPVLAVFEVLALNFIGYPAHSAVRWELPAWSHRLLVTPGVHALHHDARRAIHDANYGALFPVWDLLFGSFIAPESVPGVGPGVEGERLPSTLSGQLLHPLVRWRQGAGGTTSLE